MKIKSAVKIYTLTVPASAQQNTYSFFDSPSFQIHYFRSQEEAILYQKKHYPHLSLDSDVKIAVEDKDKQGNDRWVLIRKTEDMHNSNHNKTVDHHDYYRHTVGFASSPLLEKAIKDNPSSVIVVKECKRDGWADDGQMGGPSGTTIIYDGSDTVGKETRFLYVSGQERWFVERDQEITLTDASDLKLQSDIEANQHKLQELLAEQERLQQDQQRLIGLKKR